MSVYLFALYLVVLFVLICIALWRLLKSKSASKIAILGVEFTVLGGIIVIKSSIDNLMLSIAGYTSIGIGLLLSIIALFK